MPKLTPDIKNDVFVKCPQYLAGAVVVPDGITQIGNSAFCDCSRISSITLPDSVKSIGVDAFYGCALLTSINIPEGLHS